ncbi:hypothetical protein LCGC14_1441360 [marine sediment metagenome]|uniref:Uncharacterized protein n=1 Tax=marine sediment metagenome TaxID=412755 RepID=A0A0F9J4Y2_9ZZZZ
MRTKRIARALVIASSMLLIGSLPVALLGLGEWTFWAMMSTVIAMQLIVLVIRPPWRHHD